MTEYLDPRRFVIVGVGGTGGHLAPNIARMAEHKMPGSMVLLVDGDSYEESNASRQEFNQIGNKAEVKAQMLQEQFPHTIIVPDRRWVVEESDTDVNDYEASKIAAKTLLSEGDVVYAVVDNFAARKALFDAAKHFDNIDVFTGGNDEHLFGSVYHYQRREGKDVTEHPGEYHDDYVNPPDKNPGELSCEQRSALEGSTQTIAANMAVAAWLLGRTQKTIIDDQPDTECEIMFDLSLGMSAASDRTVVEEKQEAILTS